MAIVVETLNRRGRVIHSRYFAKNSITVGRSFENDYIVDDHYVDPVHMEVMMDDGQLICVDQQSINGLSDRKRKPLESPHMLNCGSEVMIGKTVLRIGSKRSITTPAVRLSFIENLGEYVAGMPYSIIAFCILIGMAILDIQLSSQNIDEQAVGGLLSIIFVSILLSTFFVFLARHLKHDSRFLLYFNLINTGIICSYIYDLIYPFVFFNLSISQIDNWFNDFFYTVLFSVMLYFALRFATRLKNKVLLTITSILPSLLLINAFIPDTELTYFQRYSPPYDPLVRHESWYWSEGLSHSEFQSLTQNLYKDSNE